MRKFLTKQWQVQVLQEFLDWGFRLTWRVAIDIFSPKHLATSLDSTWKVDMSPIYLLFNMLEPPGKKGGKLLNFESSTDSKGWKQQVRMNNRPKYIVQMTYMSKYNHE